MNEAEFKIWMGVFVVLLFAAMAFSKFTTAQSACIDHASKTIHVLINKGISDAPVDPDAVIKEVCR